MTIEEFKLHIKDNKVEKITVTSTGNEWIGWFVKLFRKPSYPWHIGNSEIVIASCRLKNDYNKFTNYIKINTDYINNIEIIN